MRYIFVVVALFLSCEVFSQFHERIQTTTLSSAKMIWNNKKWTFKDNDDKKTNVTIWEFSINKSNRGVVINNDIIYEISACEEKGNYVIMQAYNADLKRDVVIVVAIDINRKIGIVVFDKTGQTAHYFLNE